ncbi:MAG: cupredoxin domain-containing protein [Candidatus Baltobacteraceae bacterium]
MSVPHAFRALAFIAAFLCFPAIRTATAAPASAGATLLLHGDTLVAAWIPGTKHAPPIDAVMRNKDKAFVPDVLVIPVGSSVRFPNEDPFFHSIYAANSPDDFDIGFYGTGPGKVVRFLHPGTVNVHCHIHVFMHGIIVVADGIAASGDDGQVILQGVPVGRHIVDAVFADGRTRRMAVTIAANVGALSLRVAPR